MTAKPTGSMRTVLLKLLGHSKKPAPPPPRYAEKYAEERRTLAPGLVTEGRYSEAFVVANPLRTDPAGTLEPRDTAVYREMLAASTDWLKQGGLSGFQWFDDANGYHRWSREVEEFQKAFETYMVQCDAVPGHCGLCSRDTIFRVDPGFPMFYHAHLREGMICSHCQVHNRGRTLGLTITTVAQAAGPEARILLMESVTPLYSLLSARYAHLMGSEFVSVDLKSGSEAEVDGRRVRHENIFALSFSDASLDVIAHADVLEHVPDPLAALRECRRVLKPGGTLLFSCPFVEQFARSFQRARLSPAGEIEHLAPEEYHYGHLAYFNYGWDLLETCRQAGFRQVHIGVCFDPMQGLVSTGRFDPVGYMQPLVFRCLN